MFRPMTMLLELQRECDQQRERLRRETRENLERALQEVLPGQAVFVFGSLVKRGAFHAQSDVDLAVFELPGRASEFAIHGMLEERMGRLVQCNIDIGHSLI